MAVKIRLKRFGKIRAPYYRVVVADSRTKRDGRVIEEIGKYDPTQHPSFIEITSERAQYWLGVGAQPTEQVLALLKLTGDWGQFTGDKKAKSQVLSPEAKTEFVADEKKKPVLKPKVEKKAEEAPAADAAEAPAEDAAAETPAEETPAEETPAEETAEAPAAEASAEDAPAVEAEEPAAEEPASEDADKA